MIADLEPYPAMKDSGVEWLGEVPEHWEVVPLCALAKTKSITDQQDRELLSVYLDLGVIRFSDVKEKRTNVTSEDLSKYQAVDPGDFVLNNQQAWRGSVGVSKHSGIVSPAYLVLALDSRISSDFANLLFRERSMVAQYLVASKGVGSIQRNLYWPHLKRISTFLPLLPEQAAIVRYLDHVDRRVQQLVRAKRKLIALLTEQKQAIIHRAVTRGLDPDVPLKDSGVEWLGMVPEHWEFNRGKYYFREVDVRSTSGEEELLSVSHITGVTPRSQKNITMFKAESYVGSKICTPGQIAVNTMWAWMAAIGVSNYYGLVSPSYHTYEQLDSGTFVDEYLDLLLRSNLYKMLYTINSSGITTSRLRLYPADFLNIRFLCPPRDEQDAILEWLHDATADIDTAIARANRENELLNEFRTRLIADVVTGKLDVREAATALPDADPLAAEDDLDDAPAAEVEADSEDLQAIPEEAQA